MYYYFTDEDIQTAEANGISYKTMFSRRNLGWEKERAITEPVTKSRFYSKWHKYKDIAVVPRNTFDDRIRKGMDPETAATKPVKKRKYTDEDVKIAAKNGISESCLKQRVYTYHIPVEEARTRPKHANRGKALKKKNYSKSHWNYVKGV